MLWPDHCIQGTRGAEIADGLDIPHAQLVLRKGYHGHTDSYSGFVEADRTTRTGLAGYLRERGIRRVFCAGLATDFCVLDGARRQGGRIESFVVEDACRAIDTGGLLAAAFAAWERAGIHRIRAADVGGRGSGDPWIL